MKKILLFSYYTLAAAMLFFPQIIYWIIRGKDLPLFNQVTNKAIELI